MPQAFPHLFQPLTLRHKTLRNRIVFGAHTSNMGENGLPGERHLAYYTERALGGAGMIVVEPVPVHKTGVLTRGNFRHEDDSIIPHFRRVTEACHALGAVMIHQLYHVGQHGDWDNVLEAYPSPSGLPSFYDSNGSAEMSEALIEELIQSFIAAASRAKASGFDGIELFAAYHALIDQFWTPWSNRRTDRWGGSLENRLRFSAEIMRGIRAACGDDFIIGLAVSQDPSTDLYLSPDQLAGIVAWHDQRRLMDYVTCGNASYFSSGGIIPSFLFEDRVGAPYAERLRPALKHAVLQAEANIRTPDAAEALIASGHADMVSIVRGQIADPQLARKAQAGRAEDIRPCLTCNQVCRGRRARDYWISCLVNPSVGREADWNGDRPERAAKPKRVLVVGGGPAGLEAARVAAERGHQVTLVEAASRLGGSFRLAGLQPRRGQILELLDWYERQLAQLQVKVELNRVLEPQEIESFGADEVIVATGAEANGAAFQKAFAGRDRMPGAELASVATVEAVMSGEARPGKRVLLLDTDGDWRGVGTAWYLAEKGHEVTIVTPKPVIGAMLARAAGDGKLRAKLRSLGVRFLVESAVESWDGEAATIVDLLDRSTSRIEADTLVTATINAPRRELASALGGTAISIGDGLAVRDAQAAFYEGRKVALKL
jgi:2,4-dienoyl-CoA reductase-like NADH-dependent reductase (Old Yellow Enzyme family)/thioredoxin reductase